MVHTDVIIEKPRCRWGVGPSQGREAVAVRRDRAGLFALRRFLILI